jgi:hypothetical protein
MSAKEFLVRLYLGSSEQAEELRVLDPGDAHELAATLRQMVRARRNDSRLSDREYSRYVIHVHAANGGRRLFASCWLTPTGEVQVKR